MANYKMYHKKRVTIKVGPTKSKPNKPKSNKPKSNSNKPNPKSPSDFPIQFSYSTSEHTTINFYMPKYKKWDEHRAGWGYVMHGFTNPPPQNNPPNNQPNNPPNNPQNNPPNNPSNNPPNNQQNNPPNNPPNNLPNNPQNNLEYILVDDTVDISFKKSHVNKKPYLVPWIGFIHNPPSLNSPDCIYPERGRPESLFKHPAFIKSLPNCRGFYVFSDFLKVWLEKRLQKEFPHIPVFKLYHPTIDPKLHFEEYQFSANPKKRLIQIGYWLRKTISLWELPQIKSPKTKDPQNRNPKKHNKNYQKTWLYGGYKDYPLRVWEHQNRKFHHGKLDLKNKNIEIKIVNNDKFDQLLARNIVFIHLMSSSVNNTIVECIIRNTPIIVNKIPPIVEYLGENYPLYFNHLREVPTLASNLEKIRSAHIYLKKMDKSFLTIKQFREDFTATLPHLTKDPQK